LSFACFVFVASERESAIHAAAIENGMTLTKTRRHETASTSQTPARGPIAVEIPDHAAHLPIATPRAFPLYAVSSIARLFGTTRAPEIPCTTLAATRITMLGASAQPSELIANPISPSPNTR